MKISTSIINNEAYIFGNADIHRVATSRLTTQESNILSFIWSGTLFIIQ